jgi:hypothetical protein
MDPVGPDVRWMIVAGPLPDEFWSVKSTRIAANSSLTVLEIFE